MQNRRDFMLQISLSAGLAQLPVKKVAAEVLMSSKPTTCVDIIGDRFFVDGKQTYAGRFYKDMRVEGLLFTSRMANCIVNDQNPETRGMWAYRDGPWDPERNTNEFIQALPKYKACGLNSVAFNVQGGSAVGYGWNQPWHTSGYTPDGNLLPDYKSRLIRALGALNSNNMVAILGFFYLGATPRLANEAAFFRAADEVTDVICENNFSNVIVEVGNEIDSPYWPVEVVKPGRVSELIQHIQSRSRGRIASQAGRLMVSTSFVLSREIPKPVMECADYVLFHGNSLATPSQMRERANSLRKSPGYSGQPLVVNEDDHYDFEKADNNFLAAVSQYCGWGYFDYRQIRENFEDGYQSLPIDWGINSERKRGFFKLLSEITGCNCTF